MGDEVSVPIELSIGKDGLDALSGLSSLSDILSKSLLQNDSFSQAMDSIYQQMTVYSATIDKLTDLHDKIPEAWDRAEEKAKSIRDILSGFVDASNNITGFGGMNSVITPQSGSGLSADKTQKQKEIARIWHDEQAHRDEHGAGMPRGRGGRGGGGGGGGGTSPDDTYDANSAKGVDPINKRFNSLLDSLGMGVRQGEKARAAQTFFEKASGLTGINPKDEAALDAVLSGSKTTANLAGPTAEGGGLLGNLAGGAAGSKALGMLGKVGPWALAGTAAYMGVDQLADQYVDYRKLGQTAGEGAGAGFGYKMTTLGTSLNPFSGMSSSEAAGASRQLLEKGYKGEKFQEGWSFVAKNMQDYNIDVGSSIGLMTTYIKQAHGSIGDLNASLGGLQKGAKDSDVSMKVLTENFKALVDFGTGQGMGTGALDFASYGTAAKEMFGQEVADDFGSRMMTAMAKDPMVRAKVTGSVIGTYGPDDSTKILPAGQDILKTQLDEIVSQFKSPEDAGEALRVRLAGRGYPVQSPKEATDFYYMLTGKDGKTIEGARGQTVQDEYNAKVAAWEDPETRAKEIEAEHDVGTKPWGWDDPNPLGAIAGNAWSHISGQFESRGEQVQRDKNTEAWEQSHPRPQLTPAQAAAINQGQEVNVNIKADKKLDGIISIDYDKTNHANDFWSKLEGQGRMPFKDTPTVGGEG